MLCPFHDDKNASFSITPSKNLFRCFGCDKAGSVIDYIIARDGVDCRIAISTLINNYPHLAAENPHVAKEKTPAQQPAILDPENGASIRHIEELLGHSNLDSTIYTSIDH